MDGKTARVGLDWGDAVSTPWGMMVAEWHMCPRPAVTGGEEVPVRDVSCSEQAIFEKMISEFLFEIVLS
jgi:hypothetical protein